MMSDFEDGPATRKDIVGPTVQMIEAAPVPVAPDFADEPTLKRALCWRCGTFFISDHGERVRLPLPAEYCECEEILR